MKSYKELKVYQESYKLSLDIYEATRSFPIEEKYGIISQMRRSSVSIPCNIAEGYRRKNKKEYVQFLHIALGSCSELETLLCLSNDLGMLKIEQFERMYKQQTFISVLLYKLIQAVLPTPLTPLHPYTRIPHDQT